jgi:hypothetical protein
MFGFALNRVVVLLTPLFTTAAVAVSHLALTRFGFHVSPNTLVAVETTVGGSAAAAALKWLHGHQKYEVLQHDLETLLMVQGYTPPATPPTQPATP